MQLVDRRAHEAAADAGADHDLRQRAWKRSILSALPASQLGQARGLRRLEELIAKQASKKAGWFSRGLYEATFLLLPAWLIYRIGKNFFYDSFWLEKPLLDVGFYIPALIFLALWCGVFPLTINYL